MGTNDESIVLDHITLRDQAVLIEQGTQVVGVRCGRHVPNIQLNHSECETSLVLLVAIVHNYTNILREMEASQNT